MQKYTKSPVEKEALIKKILSILRMKSDIVFVYVFGSFNTGEKFNDIDIAIYLSDGDRASALDKELSLEVELLNRLQLPVDVRILNFAPLPFVYNVLKTGRVIVDRDSVLRSDFESLSYRKYFDFKRFRDEYLRGIKNAPLQPGQN